MKLIDLAVAAIGRLRGARLKVAKELAVAIELAFSVPAQLD